MFRHEFHVLSMLCCICSYFGSFIWISIYASVQFIRKKRLQWVRLTKKMVSERKMPHQVATERFLPECKWDGHVQVGHFQKFPSDRSFIHWRFANKWSEHVVSHMAWSLHLISVMNYSWKRQKKHVQLLNTWIQIIQLFVKSIRRDIEFNFSFSSKCILPLPMGILCVQVLALLDRIIQKVINHQNNQAAYDTACITLSGVQTPQPFLTFLNVRHC